MSWTLQSRIIETWYWCNCHRGPFPVRSRSVLLIAVDFLPFFVRIHHLTRKLTVNATTKSAKPAIRRSFYRRLRKTKQNHNLTERKEAGNRLLIFILAVSWGGRHPTDSLGSFPGAHCSPRCVLECGNLFLIHGCSTCNQGMVKF